MAMSIIIDGYNLIGSEKGLRGNLERQREQLIRDLQLYQDTKDHEIILVFDGWRSGWMYEVDEQRGGITVVYSKRGEKADDVIRRLSEEMGNQCIVVSSDREVRMSAETAGSVTMYSGEFKAKLRSISPESPHLEGPEKSRDPSKRGNPKRLSKKERRRRERLKNL